MSQKLFITDLDGTLLTKEKTVSPRTHDALRDFVSRGNRVVFSSGRSVASVCGVLLRNDLLLPGVIVSAFNGGCIYDLSAMKTLYRTTLPLDLVEELFRLAKETDTYLQTYADHLADEAKTIDDLSRSVQILASRADDNLTYYNKHDSGNGAAVEDVMRVLKAPPCKCLAIDVANPPELEVYRARIHEAFGDRIRTVYSSPFFLEVIPPDSGKGNALLKLCGILGIPVGDTIAAGDEENDISMIREAGKGIAMCNARESVREAADAVTAADNNSDGLVPFLADA